MDTNLKENSAVQDFIDKYHLVIPKPERSGKYIYMRSSINSAEEAESFVKNFSRKTKTRWIVYNSNEQYQRMVYHKSWACHRAKNKTNNLKYINCEARLNVKIKKITKHTKKTDLFLALKPPLPCVIRLNYKHNHSLEDDLKYMKLTDEEKELFCGYFDNGFGVAKSLKLYDENMQRNGRQHPSSCLTPRAQQVYHLYRLWQKKKRITGIVCVDIEDLSIFFDIEDLLNSIPHMEPKKLLRPIPQPKIIPQSITSIKDKQSSTDAQATPSSVPQFQNVLQSRLNSGSNVKKIIFVKGPMLNQHTFPTILNKQFFISTNSYPTSHSSSTQAIMPLRTPICMTKSQIYKPSLTKVSENCNVKSECARSDTEPQTILPDIYDHKVQNSQGNDADFDTLSDENSSSASCHSSADSEKSFFDPNEISAQQVCQSVYQKTNSFSSNPKDQELEAQCSSTLSVCSTFKSSTTLSSPSLSKGKNIKLEESLAKIPMFCNFTNVLSCSTNESGDFDTVQHESKIVNVDKDTLPNSKRKNMQHISADKSLKIKVEPTSDQSGDKIVESENPNIFPVISNVSSVSNLSVQESERTISRIQLEEDISMDSCTSLNTGQQTSAIFKDEDHQFLMSLLPEFKRIPRENKTKVKSKIQNIILSARLSSFRKKQKKKRRSREHQRKEVVSNMYRECRTLPSFPTFK